MVVFTNIKDNMVVFTNVKDPMEVFTNVKNPIVVFTNVEHMSSAAYGTFMKFNERVKSRDGQLRLCELKPRVYEGFVITKLNRIFSIHESWAAALDTLT